MKADQTHSYRNIISRCFINAPFEQLQSGLLELFLAHRFRPEIGLEGDCLWTAPREEFTDLAAILEKNELPCTLHAPFFDLSPGALDSRILAVSREKLQRAFDLIEIFRPRSIVCHLGYDENKHSYKMDAWLRTSAETWNELLQVAARTGTPVMFENTYETDPDVHLRLFEQLAGSDFGFCLDVGHLSAYAGTDWQLWTAKLLPFLRQLHLHDNSGERDDHIAIGAGCFDFKGLFTFLRQKNVSPLVTLEPHSEKDIWGSITVL